MLADDHRMLREGLRRSLTEEGFDVVGEAARRRGGRPPGRRAPARRRAHGRVDARDGRRRGHPPDPRAIMPERPGSSCSRCTPTRRCSPDAIRAGRNRLPRQGLLHRGDRVEAVRHGGQGRDRPVAAAGRHDARRGPPARRAGDQPRRTASSPSGRKRCSSSSPTAAPPPRWPDRLYISQKTVKNHLASIYQKLDARDRTQAVLQAVRMGIVHLR